MEIRVVRRALDELRLDPVVALAVLMRAMTADRRGRSSLTCPDGGRLRTLHATPNRCQECGAVPERLSEIVA